MVILQEYLLENLQNIQTPLQINTFKPLTPAKEKTTQTTKETKETNNACLMDDHDFPLFDMSFFGAKKQMCSVNVQTDPAAHRQQVGELCQIIQVLRRYGETETFQPQKWWIFNRKLWDFPA